MSWGLRPDDDNDSSFLVEDPPPRPPYRSFWCFQSSSEMSSANWVERMKKAGKSVVDAGAKTMLKTDIVFLDREIKNRKQTFGIEIYDLMEDLESNDSMPVQDKEAKIRAAFDAARKDIAVIQAKKECKREEMAVLEAESNAQSGVSTYNIPPSDGVVVTNDHPSQMRA